jgi:CHAD domain-containing protein
MAYRFERWESVPESFARCAREQLTAAEVALTDDLASDPNEAVHTARTSCKKVRSLLRLTRGAVDADDRRRENAALRDAAGRLSARRDTEAMTAALDALGDRYAGQIPHAQFVAVHTRLVRDGAAARTGAAGSPAPAEVAAELEAIRTRIAEWRLLDSGWAAIDRGLCRTYGQGRAAFAHARGNPDPVHLHAWRKRVKDLWYELRLLAPICGEAVRGHARDAHALCDALGDDHDLAVLRQTLCRVGTDAPADLDAVLGLLDHRHEQLCAKAMGLAERVYAEPRKAFRLRIRTYWRAGRAAEHALNARNPAALADSTRGRVAHDSATARVAH